MIKKNARLIVTTLLVVLAATPAWAAVQFRLQPNAALDWCAGAQQTVYLQVRSTTEYLVLDEFSIDLAYDSTATGLILESIELASFFALTEMDPERNNLEVDGLISLGGKTRDRQTGLQLDDAWRTIASIQFTVAEAPEYPLQLEIIDWSATDSYRLLPSYPQKGKSLIVGEYYCDLANLDFRLDPETADDWSAESTDHPVLLQMRANEETGIQDVGDFQVELHYDNGRAGLTLVEVVTEPYFAAGEMTVEDTVDAVDGKVLIGRRMAQLPAADAGLVVDTEWRTVAALYFDIGDRPADPMTISIASLTAADQDLRPLNVNWVDEAGLGFEGGAYRSSNQPETAKKPKACGPDYAACNDGLYCNGTDQCFNDECVIHSGNPCPIDDGLWCNGEETSNCIEESDTCEHTGNPCPIDDGLFCNGQENLACNEDTDSCGHEGNPCDLDDHLWCNGEETGECFEETDSCGHTGNPCPIDDGLWCNGEET